jgi:Na+/proline symporter
MMIAALFWKRSTKWGILANTLWVAGWVVFMVYAGQHYHPNQHIWGNVLYMSASGSLSFFGFTAVVPMTIGAAILVVLVSLITRPPTQATIDRYFSRQTEPREPGYGLSATVAPVR